MELVFAVGRELTTLDAGGGDSPGPSAERILRLSDQGRTLSDHLIRFMSGGGRWRGRGQGVQHDTCLMANVSKSGVHLTGKARKTSKNMDMTWMARYMYKQPSRRSRRSTTLVGHASCRFHRCRLHSKLLGPNIVHEEESAGTERPGGTTTMAAIPKTPSHAGKLHSRQSASRVDSVRKLRRIVTVFCHECKSANTQGTAKTGIAHQHSARSYPDTTHRLRAWP